MADRVSITDLEVDGTDIVYTDTKDLGTVDGLENVRQSAASSVGAEIESLIGGVISPRMIRKTQRKIKDALLDDPQIGDILSVTISKIDRPNNTVEVNVQCLENPDFTLELNG